MSIDRPHSAARVRACASASRASIPVRRRRALIEGERSVAVYVEPGAGDVALHLAGNEAVLRGAHLRVKDGIDGDVAAELVLMSQRADLIVVGLAPRTGDATPLHPLARTLAHRAGCPVMFVPSTVPTSGVAEFVCGVDRSAGSAAALHWAASAAGMRGMTVLAEQVRPWAGGPREQLTQSLSSWVFAQQIGEPTTILCRMATGSSAAGRLLRTATERNAVLVVGAPSRDDSGFQRGVTGRLVSQDRVPVVVVPPEIPVPRKPPAF